MRLLSTRLTEAEANIAKQAMQTSLDLVRKDCTHCGTEPCDRHHKAVSTLRRLRERFSFPIE